MREFEMIPLPASQPSSEHNQKGPFASGETRPAWRNLMLDAIGLSTALVVLSIARPAETPDPAQQIAACQGNPISFLASPAVGASLASCRRINHQTIAVRTIRRIWRSIPTILRTPEVWFIWMEAQKDLVDVYLVPNGVTVALGDHVQVAGGHVDQHSLSLYHRANYEIGPQLK